MRSTLEEAKAALVKSKDDMSRYYNQRRIPAPEFRPGDKVYLDGTDITSTVPFKSIRQSHVTGPSKSPKFHRCHTHFEKVPKIF
jgi:hypothetical protein